MPELTYLESIYKPVFPPKGRLGYDDLVENDVELQRKNDEDFLKLISLISEIVEKREENGIEYKDDIEAFRLYWGLSPEAKFDEKGHFIREKRFTYQTVADIIGIKRDQAVFMIKRLETLLLTDLHYDDFEKNPIEPPWEKEEDFLTLILLIEEIEKNREKNGTPYPNDIRAFRLYWGFPTEVSWDENGNLTRGEIFNYQEVADILRIKRDQAEDMIKRVETLLKGLVNGPKSIYTEKITRELLSAHLGRSVE